MTTMKGCSAGVPSKHGQTLRKLEKEVDRMVDRVMGCPKNQMDGLTRKLRRLWKERDAAVQSVQKEQLPKFQECIVSCARSVGLSGSCMETSALNAEEEFLGDEESISTTNIDALVVAGLENLNEQARTKVQRKTTAAKALRPDNTPSASGGDPLDEGARDSGSSGEQYPRCRKARSGHTTQGDKRHHARSDRPRCGPRGTAKRGAYEASSR